MKPFAFPFLAVAFACGLAHPTVAHASLITVKFSVYSASPWDPYFSGYAPTAGYFSFDSSLIPSGGGTPYNDFGLGVAEFSFAWDGDSFAAPGSDAFLLVFDASGTLTDWGVYGVAPAGIDWLEKCGRVDFEVGHTSYGFGWPFVYTNNTICGPEDSWYEGRLASWSVAPAIQASIDIDPDVLNTSSSGRSTVRAYIQLPSSYDPTAIDTSTIRLNGTAVPLQPTVVGDHNGDGTPDLMVKFYRASLSSLPLGSNELRVTGRFPAGDMFEGSDFVTVVGPGGP